jgi:hypothetical protein
VKVAIAYLTKDRVELTKQTFPVLRDGQHALFWVDGSLPRNMDDVADTGGRAFFDNNRDFATESFPGIRGGADAAIVFALTKMLEAGYDHVGLCENDVLLAPDWFEKTMRLFDEGSTAGLAVGAVSVRAYDDRILIQRDGWAVMHNLGAGHVIYTRQAAELVLANYRSGWWPDNRAVFAQLSGIDIGRYAAFRGNVQWCTADWGFDAALAQHGLASVALVPACVEMIGQEPSLEEQGLRLATEPVEERRDDLAFERFVARTASIRAGKWRPDAIKPIHQHMGTHTIFAHQLPFPKWEGEWRLRWSQGFGPFAWRADSDCSMCVLLFGPVTFLISGGKNGAKVTLTDTESGYEISPDLPAGEQQIAQVQMPAGMSYRQIVMTCGEGAVFYGVQTTEPQPIVNSKFDYHSLPPV